MPRPGKTPALVRHIAGVLPRPDGWGIWHEIRVYENNSIVIERGYCTISPRHEFGRIAEDDYRAHRHFAEMLRPW